MKIGYEAGNKFYFNTLTLKFESVFFRLLFEENIIQFDYFDQNTLTQIRSDSWILKKYLSGGFGCYTYYRGKEEITLRAEKFHGP